MSAIIIFCVQAQATEFIEGYLLTFKGIRQGRSQDFIGGGSWGNIN